MADDFLGSYERKFEHYSEHWLSELPEDLFSSTEEPKNCLHVKFDQTLTVHNTKLRHVKEILSQLAVQGLRRKAVLRQIKNQDGTLELVLSDVPLPLLSYVQIQELNHLQVVRVYTERYEYWQRPRTDGSSSVDPQGRRMYKREVFISFRLNPVSELPPELIIGICDADLLFDNSRNPLMTSLSSYMGGGGGGYSRNDRKGRRKQPEPRKIIHHPVEQKVEFCKAEVRWTRTTERAAEMEEEEKATEDLYRKFQGILNKLTPTKFQSLAEQALLLNIDTKERLSGCVDKVFTKAIREPMYSIAYANLCKVMSPIKAEWTTEDGKIKQTNFRRMLLTKCQHEFEKDKKDDETLKKMKEEIANAESESKRQELTQELGITMTLMRKRSLGNIRFIGELFNLKMLSETIMHECITRLLKSACDEVALECFGKLISTTGRDLDKPEAKARIDTYFQRIGDIIKKSKIPARIKFLLRDAQDLRSNGWVPRQRQDKQLKTIEQIHAEAKMEEQKEKEMVKQYFESKRRREFWSHETLENWRDRGRRGAQEDWRARETRSGADRTTEMEEEEKTTEDQFHEILNELTPTKFQALAEQALTLTIDTKEKLSGCIDKIFTKALEEPNFNIAYANLCKVMSPIKVEWTTEDGKIKQTNFRRMLLTKCQHEFEKDKKDDETLDKMKEEIANAESESQRQELTQELGITMTLMRKRSLGNIRFIGELFNLKMLSETIMHECITRLLKSTSDEEALECFSEVITVTGKNLDRPEAKPRMDIYFQRVGDIIKKRTTPPRIKSLLQEVQDLRSNGWPRQQHDSMVTGLEEWQGSKGADRDRKEASREKFDGTKVAGILSKRKEKGTTQTQLGPKLRPGGWKSKSGTTTSPALDTKKPSRRSKRGSHVKGFNSGVEHAHMTPEQEREAALQTVSQFVSPVSFSSSAQAVLLRKQPSAAPPPHKMDESTFRRKTVSIIDELVNNGDFKEAVECVKDLRSPDQMGILVNEGINYTLEKKAELRVATGKLFNKLVQEKVLTQDKFLEGLNDVLEFAEDICIDIPQFWDYLGEVLAPVMSHSTLSLSLLGSVPSNLVSSGRAAKLVAKVLQQCHKELGSSEEAVKSLWMQSRLNWNALGMSDQDLEEFLVDQKLEYLRAEVEQVPSYLSELQQRLQSESTNDEVLQWIKEVKCPEDVAFVKTLAMAAVQASVTGSGSTAIYTCDQFERRLDLVKMYAVSEKHRIQVLYGLQCAVANLSYPHNLLKNLFNITYDAEVVNEEEFYFWEESGAEQYGRGNAMMAVKSFFEWLRAGTEDAQNQT